MKRGPQTQKDNRSKNPVKTATPKKGYLQKKIQQHQKQISHKRGK